MYQLRTWTKTALNGWTSEIETFETKEEAEMYGEQFVRMKRRDDLERSYEVINELKTKDEIIHQIAEMLCDYNNERFPDLTADDWYVDAMEVLYEILQNGERENENKTRFFIPTKYSDLFGAIGSIVTYDEIRDDEVVCVGYELK